MPDNNNSRLLAALLAGYALGRFKKLRLAIIVGSVLGNKNVRDGVVGFVQSRTQGPSPLPGVSDVTGKVAGQVATAAKSAAHATATAGIDRLGNQLHERSTPMRERSVDGAEDQDQSEDDNGDELNGGGQAGDEVAEDEPQNEVDEEDQGSADEPADSDNGVELLDPRKIPQRRHRAAAHEGSR